MTCDCSVLQVSCAVISELAANEALVKRLEVLGGTGTEASLNSLTKLLTKAFELSVISKRLCSILYIEETSTLTSDIRHHASQRSAHSFRTHSLHRR